MSRIEQIITEIEEYIENCKYQPLSSSKIIVNKEEIDELISELKLRTPDEIKKYQKIISNKDAILKDAQEKSDALLAETKKKSSSLINEHEITQQAYEQAKTVINDAAAKAQEMLDNASVRAQETLDNATIRAQEMLSSASLRAQEILDNATLEANDLRTAAMDYLDGSMAEIQQVLSVTIQDATTRNNALIEAANGYHDAYIKTITNGHASVMDSLEKALNRVSEDRRQLVPPQELAYEESYADQAGQVEE